MAHGHTTFAGLFNDASRDTFLVGGTYDAFLPPFNITGVMATQPQLRSVNSLPHPQISTS
jgi:hypothetical protein